MGNFASKNFENMLEDSTAVNLSTPGNMKPLKTDPRSPSEEITRTPILVGQTPNAKNRIILGNNSDSPSASLLRTPLSSVNQKLGKRSSFSKRILGKLSQSQKASNENAMGDGGDDENEGPVTLLRFELSTGDSCYVSDSKTDDDPTNRPA